MLPTRSSIVRFVRRDAREDAMRMFLGMVLGCVLTIAIVYLHDNARGTTAGDSAALASRPIVNWDVATGEWNRVTENIRLSWNRLTNSDRGRI